MTGSMSSWAEIPGRVALVTAASSGIGLATATALARAGARVAINARDADRLAKAAETIREQTGREVLPLPGDLREPELPALLVGRTAGSLGPVEILVANVGGPSPGSFDAMDDSAWDGALDAVLRPAVRLSRAVLPSMRSARFGRIVHVLSMTVREPVANLTASNVLRPGLVGLVADMARENAVHGITINAVCPGYTRTPRIEEVGATNPEMVRALEARIPTGRLASADEIAAGALFFASDAASYVTGTAMPIDGGVTARP